MDGLLVIVPLVLLVVGAGMLWFVIVIFTRWGRGRGPK
jgi:hypothetical protein